MVLILIVKLQRRDYNQATWSVHISVKLEGSDRYTNGIAVNKIGEKFYRMAWRNGFATVVCEVSFSHKYYFAGCLLDIRWTGT